MKVFTVLILSVFVVSTLPAQVPPQAISIPATQVLQMVREGVKTPIIIDFINDQPRRFKLSLEDKAYLKKMRIGNVVLAAMLNHDTQETQAYSFIRVKAPKIVPEMYEQEIYPWLLEGPVPASPAYYWNGRHLLSGGGFDYR